MKLLVVTPVFPPEISSASREIKEMSLLWQKDPRVQRLSILGLGRVHEEVENVSVFLLSKHQSRFLRMAKVGLSSFRLLREHTLLYAHEGVNSSLPALVAARLRRRVGVFHFTKDEFSHSRTNRLIQSLTFRAAHYILASEEYYKLIEESFPQYVSKTTRCEHAPLPKSALPFENEDIERKKQEKQTWDTYAKKHLDILYEFTT